MKTKLLLVGLLAGAAISVNAQVEVSEVRTAGPYKIQKPMMLDSVDASQKSYSTNLRLDLDLWKNGKIGSTMKGDTDEEVFESAFSFSTKKMVKAGVKVEGADQSKVYVNGQESSGQQDLQPGQYDVVVVYTASKSAPTIKIESDDNNAITVVAQDTKNNGKRPFTLADNMLMRHYGSVNVSPSGKYAIVSNSGFNTSGKTTWQVKVIEVATNQTLLTREYDIKWMPKTDKVLETHQVDGKRQLVAIDPSNLKETVLCADLPNASYYLSPTEDFLILYQQVEGPRKEEGVYQILTPEDRQPDWRNRGTIQKMDLKTGLIQPLVFGYRSMWPNDISDDGKYLLFSVKTDNYTGRITALTSVYRLNLETLESELLIDKDGFISNPIFIQGTNKLAVVGGPEAFNSVGKNVPEGMIPNSYDHQLFVLDMSTKKVDPVTKDFNPSINDILSCKQDGMVYFSAQNADSVSLYRLDVKTGKIQKLEQPLEVVTKFDVSNNGSTMLYYGTGATTSDRLCFMNTKSLKSNVMEVLNEERLKDVLIGECKPLCFKSKNGYALTGHYYLPANFDPNKKYPMIVHYYGGCSPTARRFGNGTHYPAHYWNALGYVVLILNPRGASGFGQEWGAYHVNTAGEGIAEDIIEATQYFIDHNSFVNADKIGCVSASYGGFMTQLLLTKTDMFATGISHAGISDHTSYWGEGYWGYSYSEVSMANSYPWTRKDLYVDRSPLFNANKIHKPLLFTHGTADTNVPIGESIQMYTALKLLGIPTAFVMVEGENHGIMDYTKRQKWINTMAAWFQKYLQDDDSWWKGMYGDKDL